MDVRGENLIETPIDQIERRYKAVRQSLGEIAHKGARRADLQFEMSSYILEMWCKHRDGDFQFIEGLIVDNTTS